MCWDNQLPPLLPFLSRKFQELPGTHFLCVWLKPRSILVGKITLPHLETELRSYLWQAGAFKCTITAPLTTLPTNKTHKKVTLTLKLLYFFIAFFHFVV